MASTGDSDGAPKGEACSSSSRSSSRFTSRDSSRSGGSTEATEPTSLTIQVLQEITDNFSEKRALGQGGYGKVYKGVYVNGEAIAVKLLYNNMQAIDDKQFQHEFDNLMMLKHTNIVRLVGYCYETRRQHMDFQGTIVFSETTYKALCFEYMHMGSLRRHLSDEFSGLDWQTRYKIIRGTCEGLKYLHKGFKHPVYHLDLKPDNILLDENMVPKLADFGLSKLFDEEQTKVTQSTSGTIGYMPPEYLFGHVISEKLDIFSLGVVMTQIIAGPKGHTSCAEMDSQEFLNQIRERIISSVFERKNKDMFHILVKKVHENWSNRLKETCTSSLILEAYCQQVNICTKIGVCCMKHDRKNRPTIVDIVHKLDKTEAMIDKVTDSPGKQAKQYSSSEPRPRMQIKPGSVCAQIGIQCIGSDPEKRPDAQHIVDSIDETETADEDTETGMITSQQAENAPDESQQDTPIALAETSSKVLDSPNKQGKQYTSSDLRPTPIKPRSVQLVIKNNTVAPLWQHKQKVMLELTGGDYTSDRPGLDLVAVVDGSSNMQDEKIVELKTAMTFLIRKLSLMDRLSVITFAFYAKQLWPLRPVTDASQRELEDMISKLEPNQSYGADIEEGLREGLKVLAGRGVCVDRVAAIMLVSTGYQTYGDPTLVDASDVAVYTFYFGHQKSGNPTSRRFAAISHQSSDPMVLAQVAAKSMGGTFSHVVDQDTGGLTMAFSQCLAGLLTVAVQNLELTVAAVTDESTTLKVSAGSYPQDQHKDSVTIRFGNLYSTEMRTVIVELLLPAIYIERSAMILDITCSHNRSNDGMMKFVETLTVRRTYGDCSREESQEVYLLSEEARLQTVQMIEEARKTMADYRNMDAAHDKLVDALNVAEGQSNSYLRTELHKLLELFKTRETYEMEGLLYALSSESSHNRQRLVSRGADIEVMRLYATPRMEKYLEQAKKFLNQPTMLLPSVDDDVKEEDGALTVNVTSREEEMKGSALDIVPTDHGTSRFYISRKK